MIAATSAEIAMGVVSLLFIGAGLGLLWCAVQMKREERRRRPSFAPSLTPTLTRTPPHDFDLSGEFPSGEDEA